MTKYSVGDAGAASWQGIPRGKKRSPAATLPAWSNHDPFYLGTDPAACVHVELEASAKLKMGCKHSSGLLKNNGILLQLNNNLQ